MIKKKFFNLFLTVLIATAFLNILFVHAATFSGTILLDDYGTYINFSSAITIDSMAVYTDHVAFANVSMGGSTLSSLELSVQNANMTVTSLYASSAKITLTLTSDLPSSQVVEVYTSSPNVPTVTVNGSTYSSWVYASGTTTISLNNTAYNTVDLDYSLYSPPPITPSVDLGNWAGKVHLPIQTHINQNVKSHFGHDWILSYFTDLHITAWITDGGWINYTVDTLGIQQVYTRDARAAGVYVDGVLSPLVCSNRTVTVSTANYNASIFYGVLLTVTADPAVLPAPFTLNGTSYTMPINLTVPVGTYVITAQEQILWPSGYYNFTSWTISTDGTSTSSTIILTLLSDTYLTANYNTISGWQLSNLYLHTSTQSVNNFTGYVANFKQDDAATPASFWQTCNVSGATVQYCLSVWALYPSGKTDTLADHDGTITVATATTGKTIGVMYNMPSADLLVGMEALKLCLYVRFNGGSWLPSAYFVTGRLYEKAVNAGNWTLNLYVSVSYTPAGTMAYAYWGSSATRGGVGGLTFTVPLPQEIAVAKGMNGDWIGMFIYPFIFVIGDLFYGLMLLFSSGVLCLKLRKWEPVLVLIMLFGGGGLLGALIPDVAYRVFFGLVLIMVGLVIYRIFR